MARRKAECDGCASSRSLLSRSCFVKSSCCLTLACERFMNTDCDSVTWFTTASLISPAFLGSRFLHVGRAVHNTHFSLARMTAMDDRQDNTQTDWKSASNCGNRALSTSLRNVLGHKRQVHSGDQPLHPLQWLHPILGFLAQLLAIQLQTDKLQVCYTGQVQYPTM